MQGQSSAGVRLVDPRLILSAWLGRHQPEHQLEPRLCRCPCAAPPPSAASLVASSVLEQMTAVSTLSEVDMCAKPGRSLTEGTWSGLLVTVSPSAFPGDVKVIVTLKTDNLAKREDASDAAARVPIQAQLGSV